MTRLKLRIPPRVHHYHPHPASRQRATCLVAHESLREGNKALLCWDSQLHSLSVDSSIQASDLMGRPSVPMQASHFSSFLFYWETGFLEGSCCCEASAFICCAGDYDLCLFLQTEHLSIDFFHPKKKNNLCQVENKYFWKDNFCSYLWKWSIAFSCTAKKNAPTIWFHYKSFFLFIYFGFLFLI